MDGKERTVQNMQTCHAVIRMYAELMICMLKFKYGSTRTFF